MEHSSILSGKPELRFGILIKEVPLLEPSDIRNGQLALPQGWKQFCEDAGQSEEETPLQPSQRLMMYL